MNYSNFTFMWFFLLLSLISHGYCTNPPKRKKTTDAAPLTAAQHENDVPPDSADADPINVPIASRSLAQWQSLNKEALILFSNAVNLPISGRSVHDMASSLFIYYHPESESSSSVSGSTVEATSQISTNPGFSSPLNVANSPLTLLGNSVMSTGLVQQQSSNPASPSAVADLVRQEVTSVLSSLFSPAANGQRGVSSVPDGHIFPLSSGPNFPLSSQPGAAATGSVNHNLPAIPAAVLEKIRRGEFVNFDLLLPNNVPSEVRNTFTMSLDTSDISQGPKIVVRNGAQSNKIKVIDLHSWFLAWCLFFQAYIIFRGHLSCQMAKYQIFIAQLATNYRFESWYGYDQAFRMFIANNPQAQWDCCNEDIYNVHIRGAPGRLFCYNCKGKDHFSSACPDPNRASSFSPRSSALRPSFPAPGSGAMQRQAGSFPPSSAPFLNPQIAQSAARSTEFCHSFNYRHCNFSRCQRIHRCLKCNLPHPASQCTTPGC